MWGNVPGGYRNTINDNVVLIEMIETIDGAKDAHEIAAIPGVTARLCGQRRPGQFFRLQARHAGLRAADQHRARRGARVRASGCAGRSPGVDRPDFTCFQNGSETAAIARGVAAELGPLKDTQGKPEVGPYAPKK